MRKIKYIFLLVFGSHVFHVGAQIQKSTPKSILGYEIGERFTPHFEMLQYFDELQKAYPTNIQLASYGKTYENRKLIYLLISSEENIKNLSQIQQNHMNGTDERVSIVWLSYNVHGNESSGSEAAMQTAYELLQPQNSPYLENTLIIMDPCMNPDGRDRYVNFYNQYGNTPVDLQSFAVEHNETWPGGRPNHYLFDLNRDWAWMTQIESQNRVHLYNQWLPHVHVDFHEQGIDDPYYFPPAAEPYHKVITDWQREFQLKIGKNHAKHFDNEGWLYFSKEIFDLLYPSYGDTYPMFSGAIGMTYEQGGSHRGGLGVINSRGDTLTLKDRVDHHVCAGISTVETASQNAKRLIKEFNTFNDPKRFKYKSFIFSGNRHRVKSILALLDRNKIHYTLAPKKGSVKVYDYDSNEFTNYKMKGREYLVTVDQQKGALVEVLFEPKTELSDSLTYDISAWTLPYAFGIQCYASEELISPEAGSTSTSVKKEVQISNQAYAIVVDWNAMNSAKLLSSALQKNMSILFNKRAFKVGGKEFLPGSLIFLAKDNTSLDFFGQMKSLIEEFDVDFYELASGFVDEGVDMGSSDVVSFKSPNVGLLFGENFSSLSIGESWHFFEQELKYPLHLIWGNGGRTDLSKVNTIVFPEAYEKWEKHDQLMEWVEKGGHLIVMGSSAQYFCSEDLGIELKEMKDTSEVNVNYENRNRHEISTMIIGAIYDTELDRTHPLCYGLGNYQTLRLSAEAYKSPNAPIVLSDHAKPSNGFVGFKALPNQQKSTVATQLNHGRGTISFLTDNPLFRGFWEQGKLLFSNALFYH